MLRCAASTRHYTQPRRTNSDLDESFLLLAGKTTEAIEAFAFAVAVVKAAVGAGGKLGEVAEVVVVVDLSNGTCDRTGSTSGISTRPTGSTHSSCGNASGFVSVVLITLRTSCPSGTGSCTRQTYGYCRVVVGAGEILVLVAGAVAAVDEVSREFLDVFAGAVAGASLGAGGTTAAFAFVAIEALALARLAVADALVAAFGVVVSLVGAISSVGPSKSGGAGTCGTIGTLPVLVAGALVLGTADAIARAGVGTGGVGHDGEAEDDGGSFHDAVSSWLVVR